MSIYERKNIPVTNLFLDPRNPRHGISDNQVEAIYATLDDQGRKIINLANDIVEVGLNPSDLPIVIPNDNEIDKYTVLEGNRRVLSLKLLLNPPIIKDYKSGNLYKKFQELNERFTDNYIEEIPCVVFKKREDANRWIKLKHTGENDGVGIVSWGGIEVARFTGSPSLQIVEFVKNEGNLSTDEKEGLADIAISNLERLVGDLTVREVLGISIHGDRIETNLKKNEVIKGLEKIVRDLVHKNINVNHIRLKKHRADYLESFNDNELPSHNNRLSHTWELMSAEEKSEEPKKDERDASKKSKHLSTTRKSLIPTSFIVPISNKRVNAIYRELKRIKVDDNNNAIAVLLRVFLELSVDKYIENRKLQIPSDQKLVKKIKSILERFKNENILNDNKLKPVRTAISNPHSLFSTHTFNAYVHNVEYEPIPSELKLTWNNMEDFMKKLLEEL